MAEYLQDILAGEQQRQITGRGRMTSDQVRAAYEADIGARYSAEQKSAYQNRSLAISEKAEAYNEAAGAQNLALNKEKLEGQQQAEKTQSLITGTAVAAYAAPQLYSAGKAAYGGFAATQAVAGAATPEAAAVGGDAAASSIAAAATAGEAEAASAALETGAAYGGYAAGTAEAAAAAEAAVGAETAYTGAAVAATETGFWAAAGEVVADVVVAAAAAWVLCSEAVRQGYLEQEIVDTEWEYIKKTLTWREYTGYRTIADPLVKAMQNYKLARKILVPLIRAFAYEMASRVNPKIKGSKLGSFILWAGLPLCRFLYDVKFKEGGRECLNQHTAE